MTKQIAINLTSSLVSATIISGLHKSGVANILPLKKTKSALYCVYLYL